MNNRLQEIYIKLHDQYGPQHWWPGDTPFEIMIGAVLTQNTNWNNVSRAIDNLRDFDLLSFEALENLPIEVLAEHIRPSGYFNQKAKKLKVVSKALISEGYLDNKRIPSRDWLLSLWGIGPETADSILLYAYRKPFFVVDAYTKRIFRRLSLIMPDANYDQIQRLFLNNFKADNKMFNEYHALIVQLEKEFCKKSKPLCSLCPLKELDGFVCPLDNRIFSNHL